MRKCLAQIAFLLALAGAAVAQPPQQPLPTANLGERRQDQIYPITLLAQNLNCKTPQDFRFDLAGAPFIVAEADPVARQVPAGGEKTIPARIVAALAPPGELTGVIATICETCRPTPVFGNNCRADRSQIVVRIVIVPAPSSQAPLAPPVQPRQEAGTAPAQTGGADGFLNFEIPPPPPPGPAEPLRCAADLGERASFSRPPDSLEAFLDGAQKRALDEARRKAAAASGAARAAQDELEGLRRKKRDCEEELAALRAEQQAKEAAMKAAEAAATDAQNALDRGPEKKAAEAAQKAVDSFQRDVDKAQVDFDRWTEAAQRQQNYLEIVIGQEGGLSSRRGQNAKRYYDDAARKREDARAALARVKQSMDERQAALAAAQQALAAAQAAADARRAEAEAARSAAEAAKQAAEAKQRECLDIEAQAQTQARNASAADKAAADAERAASRGERDADSQARRNLDAAIACKKEECERIRRKWDEHFRRLTNARNALEKLGYFKPRSAAEAGSIAASAAKQAPDSLWKDYLKLGWDTFMATASAIASERYPGRFVPGTGASIVLDVLQAAYGIAGIYQSALRPGTYAHGRTEGAALHAWLQRNNFAHADRGDADAREVEKQMERLMKDPGVIAKDLDAAIREAEKCKEELAGLEAQKSAS